uniref:NAD(P)-binding domain-containing protein n=1 Tax=Petromyzon marinus TaxID=7757 RepID=S4RMM2_PETMA
MASAVKKVVVFGATGMTGLEVLPQAVKAGYTVTAFVRNAALLPAGLALEVVTGDVLNPEDVSRAVAGQDAVVIVLGTRNELGET